MLTRLELPNVNPMFETLGDVLLVTDTVCLDVTATDDVAPAVEDDNDADDLREAETADVALPVEAVTDDVDFKAPTRLPTALSVLPDTVVAILLEAAIEAVVETVEAVAETVALDDTETDAVLAAVEELIDAELLLDRVTDDVA